MLTKLMAKSPDQLSAMTDQLDSGKNDDLTLLTTSENSRLNQVVPRRKDVFEFEKLPAELRNDIYKLLLVAESPIAISRHEYQGKSEKGKSWETFFNETQLRQKSVLLSAGHSQK